MNIKAGLVGLPNVGKSTLFNALTKAGVAAENYPFCTIDPSNACTPVDDERQYVLQKIYKSEKIIPTITEFVDIAGLVKGASKGEGLGNQFLSHIKEVALIIHVLRCFDDSDIIHTQNTVDPLRDFLIIQTELALKDLETLENRKSKIPLLSRKTNSAQEKEAFEQELKEIEIAIGFINNEKYLELNNYLFKYLFHLNLLSLKKYLIVANIREDEVEDPSKNIYLQNLYNHFDKNIVIPISAKIEQELSTLPEKDAEEYRESLGIKKKGLSTIIEKTYNHLGLISFFTCGPKEIHAWQIEKGTTIKKAAGEIHSDLEKGFISATVYSYSDLVKLGSPVEMKNQGKVKMVGSDYIVEDGDIVLINFYV